MLRQTRLAAAAEFKQKSRWSKVWPNMHYGAMYLNYSIGRQVPMRGVNWVTRDSNRLTNFENRYASVVADLDVKKNEEELNIPLNEVRWNDHRRIYWLCNFCGSPYRKNVSVRTKFHAGCNRCKGREASEVLKEQRRSPSLQEAHPALAAQLLDNGKQANIACLSGTSKFLAQWTCGDCGGTYEATIRSRTGLVEAGQVPMHPQSAEWAGSCPNCRWKRNMMSVTAQGLQAERLMGLPLSSSVAGKGKSHSTTQAIPRRKKLVV